MTLQEFAALKPGDKVTNPMQGSSGEVTEISEAGVRVAWGGAHAVTFTYGVGSTAWMHWSKEDMHTENLNRLSKDGA